MLEEEEEEKVAELNILPVSMKKGKTFIMDSPNPSSATSTKTWFPGPRGDVLNVKLLPPVGKSCDYQPAAVIMIMMAVKYRGV